jgi:hypothetical protein
MGLESGIRKKTQPGPRGQKKHMIPDPDPQNTGCENFVLNKGGGRRHPCEARQGGGRARFVVGPVPSTGHVRLARHRRIQRLSRLR